MKNIFFYETSIGRIGITDNGEAVTGLMFTGKADAAGAMEADTAGVRGTDAIGAGKADAAGAMESDIVGAGEADAGGTRGSGTDGAMESDAIGAGETESAGAIKAGTTGASKADADPCVHGVCPDGYTVAETALIKEAAKQLNEYLEGKRKVFDIPLALDGTPFQKQVWKALQDIPYGETRSYRDIAESIGRPRACRAVGMANNKNPIAVFVPCHRVIGSDGKLVGYAGGMDVKQKLLALERHE